MYRNSPFNRNDVEPLIIFLGAGASFSSGVPVASELKEVIYEILPDNSKQKEYILNNYVHNAECGIQDLANYLEANASLAVWYAFKGAIARKLYKQSPIISAEYRMLAFLIKHEYISAIYTTNQDICLECSLDALGIPYNRFVYHPQTKQKPEYHVNENVDIFKLCGDLHTPYEMCFSENELMEASRSKLFKSLTDRFNQKCRIVFIGYSACSDPIGEALCTASQNRKKRQSSAILYCVDIKTQDGHSKLFQENCGDHIIIKSAESFLSDEIIKIKPQINVEHALWNQKGFGGIQTYVYSLIKIFKDFNENVSASCYCTNDFAQNTDVNTLGFSFDLASARAETIQTICSKRPDLIHAHNFISAQMAETIGVPCIFTSHSLESKEGESKTSLFGFSNTQSNQDPFAQDIKKYEYLYYHQLSSIIALSQAHINDFPVDVQPRAKLTRAPFISPDQFLNIDVSAKSSDIRKRLKPEESGTTIRTFHLDGNTQNNGILSENTPTIAFFGRPDIRKGLHIFIRIIEILADRDVQFQALCVGPKWLYKDNKLYVIEERSSYNITYSKVYKNGITISDKGLRKLYVVSDTMEEYTQENFIEHLKNMYTYFLLSDVIIMPSSYETFGYVALEAMSCNRPVIASNIGGLRELLNDDRGTLIDVTFSDSTNITESIAQRFAESAIQIMNTPPVGQVKKAKAWVDQEYSKDNMGKLSSDIYEYYLKCIISGMQTGPYDLVGVNQLISDSLSQYTSWKEILLHTSDVYQSLRTKYYSSSKDSFEFYDLFWNIAYWIKANKSSCSEISFIPLKELAELITEITRFQPKASNSDER